VCYFIKNGGLVWLFEKKNDGGTLILFLS